MFYDKTVILASASPRRTQLLSQAGISHMVLPSDCEEIVPDAAPDEVVKELSRQKAEDVYKKYTNEHKEEKVLVIGADTVVASGGKILGKPKSREEAYAMISGFQGRAHEVYTGVTLITGTGDNCTSKSFAECSLVNVYPMTEKEIWDYIATGEPMDKAGAYGIQGRFAIHVQGIEGDYNNIVGLPIARIYQEIKE